jgi:hypothetical protein
MACVPLVVAVDPEPAFRTWLLASLVGVRA